MVDVESGMLPVPVAASPSTVTSFARAPSPDEPPALSDATSFALDLLRGVTAEAVVVGHAISFFRVLPGLQPPYVPAMQEVGVVIFFVLSGFLIAHTTWVRKSKTNTALYGFRTFFIDRFARIYSGYLPALVFIGLADCGAVRMDPTAYVHHEALNARTAIGNVLMLENFPALDFLHRRFTIVPAIDRLGSGRPLWTLAVEWWIYMFFGWLVLGRSQSRPLRYWSILAVLAIVPAWNMVSGLGEGIALAWIYGAIACALMWRRGSDVFARRTWLAASLAAAGLAVVRAAFSNGRAYDGALVAVIAVAVTTGIFALQQSRFVVPKWVRRSVRYLADYSFTLYLVHYTVLEATMLVRGRASDPVLVLGGIVVANLVAIGLAHVGEMRHRALSRYLHERFS